PLRVIERQGLGLRGAQGGVRAGVAGLRRADPAAAEERRHEEKRCQGKDPHQEVSERSVASVQGRTRALAAPRVARCGGPPHVPAGTLCTASPSRSGAELLSTTASLPRSPRTSIVPASSKPVWTGALRRRSWSTVYTKGLPSSSCRTAGPGTKNAAGP